MRNPNSLDVKEDLADNIKKIMEYVVTNWYMLKECLSLKTSIDTK